MSVLPHRERAALWALLCAGGSTLGVACRTDPQKERGEPAVTPRRNDISSRSTQPSPAPATDSGSVGTTSSARAEATIATAPAPPPVLDESHDDVRALAVKEQQQYLIELVTKEHRLSADASQRLRQIVEKSDWLSFGNPKVSKPSMTKAECRQRRQTGDWRAADAQCPSPNMVVIAKDDQGAPKVCIDQYEFPNVPCEYPVVWVRSSEAAAICQAEGKRLCDAHEWEGACAGEVLPSEEDYPWGRMPKSIAHSPMREQRLWLEYEHNRTRQVRWAYGDHVNHALCGTGAIKEPRCDVIDFGTCSSSTYPAGSFPECVSPFGVYDQHGNAAEHMNLPLKPSELTGAGGSGWTEMKGSWFIFANQQTHPDDCRWRAKSWHTTRIDEWNSHRNYHLGFRCCADVKNGENNVVETGDK